MSALLTPRTDAALQLRFLKALRRKGRIYASAQARHPGSDHLAPILHSIGQTARLAWQYGASLEDVAAAVGLTDPPAVLGLDDTEVPVELAMPGRWTA